MSESRTQKSLTSSIGLAEYDLWTIKERTDTKLMSWDESRLYNVFCLASEAGEVADAVKRQLRGDYGRSKCPYDYGEDILLELGDILHYVCRIADDHGFTLEEVAAANVEKLTNRKKYGKGKAGKRS